MPKPAPSTARRPPAGKAAMPPPRRTERRRPFPVIPVGIGLVLLLAAFALAVGVASDDDGSDQAPANVAQVRPVNVTGSQLPPFEGTGADPAIGRAAPEVDGASFDNSPVAIIRDGEPKLITFLAHWCSHCQAEVPVIVDWMAAGAPQGVDVYAVSTSVDATRPNYPPSTWLAEEDWAVPTLADDDADQVGAAFGLTGFPYFVAVSADGKVTARASGEQSVTQLEALAAAARR